MPEPELDVVVVGYRSSEDFERLKEDLPRACDMPWKLRYFDNTGNPKTLTRCWNELAFQGSARWIAFLNTDIRLSPHWDGRLLDFMAEHPDVGAALPWPAGHTWPADIDPQAKPYPVPASAPPPPWEAMVQLSQKALSDERFVSWGSQCNASFYSVIIERTLFESIKGFDERFRYYYQDHDFQRRMLARHNKVAAKTAKSRVWHRDGGSRREAEKRGEVYFGEELRHFGTIKSAIERGELAEWDTLSDQQRVDVRHHPLYSRMPMKDAAR